MGQAPSSQAGMVTPCTHPCLSGCPMRASVLPVQPLVNRGQQGKKQSGCEKASGQQVSVAWNLPGDSPSCSGRPSQLHQWLVVLGRNAAAVKNAAIL